MKSSIILPDMKGKIDCAKLSLPALSGVRGLSKNEIKKDLQHIDHFDKSDSESVCSAASDDVLPSSYPVKPRRQPRIQKESRGSRSQKSEADVDQNSVGSAIEFLRIVETARPEIFEAEKEREDLEIRYQALKEMCMSVEEASKKRKALHENYLGALQSTCLRRACEFQLRSDYNAMLSDLIMAARAQNRITAEYSSSSSTNGASLSRGSYGAKASRNGTSHGHDDSAQNGTPDPGRCVVFYVSQVLNTPMGAGEITTINTTTHTLTIALPFGLMHSVFSEAASWFTAAAAQPDTYIDGHGEYHHLSNIYSRWTDPHRATVGIDTRHKMQIRRILAPPSPAVPASDGGEESPASQCTPTKAPARRKAGSKGKKSRGGSSVAATKQTSCAMVIQPADGTDESTKAHQTSSGHKNQIAVPPPADETDLASDTFEYLDPATRVRNLFIAPGTLPYVVGQYFHQPLAPASDPKKRIGDKALQISSYALNRSHRHRHSDLDENLLYYPTACDLEQQTVFSELSEECAVPVEDTCSTEKENTMGSAMHDSSESEDILGKLRPILERIKACAREKTKAAHEVATVKMRTKRLYQEMSCTRLGMFTERMATGREMLLTSAPLGDSTAKAPVVPAKSDRRSRSGIFSKQVVLTSTENGSIIPLAPNAVTVDTATHSGASINDASSQDSSVEAPVPQYTYDSIGRRRLVKPPSASARNNKRRKPVEGTIDVAVGNSVHTVKVTEMSPENGSSGRRPKRPRR